MKLDLLAWVALAFAAIPCALFLLNLLVYRRLAEAGVASEAVSVLIPARNEAKNLHAILTSVLANRDCQFEIVVLDDHSTDGTAEIVRQIAQRDARVRLESAPPLPRGWCGKQHACHVLAQHARNPLLVFVDADVRLATDALVRMIRFVNTRGVALASGVPRQEFGTFAERLFLPLIHFVLLGFLPMHGMRWTRSTAMSAGCGQLFIARREAYEACGGHAMLRDSLHDGVKLPRVFRRAGFRTDLFDATDLAVCRMYHSNRETWRGLGKNATEGLAAPGTILPMTLLLFCGQVLPFVLLAMSPFTPSKATNLGFVALVLVYVPRFIAAIKFRQPLASALLHPVGILALLAIQWQALYRCALGRRTEWKGRTYGAAAPV